MFKNGPLFFILVILLTIPSKSMADKSAFKFDAISSSANSLDWNPSAPWILPQSFTQTVVSDETDLNIYNLGRDDLNDMNTVNETGHQAGRYLYRTHEISFPYSLPGGGAISVVDLESGKASIVAQDPSYNSLDGIRWSPWGTIVFAEETDSGRFFELSLNDDLTTVKDVHERSNVGRLAHEGIEFDADGNLYVIDEHRGRSAGCNGLIPCGGGIYKFVAENYGDLSSGLLYVLKVSGSDGVGQGEWVGPINPLKARESGTVAGGQSYQRPEDLEIIKGVLYVAITEGPRDRNGKELYEGRVISINLETMQVRDFVKPGMNVSVEIGRPGEEEFQTGFDSIDNLAQSPDGDLIMIEDNNPSDIWFASTQANESGESNEVKLFASLTDPEAEGTGIYFSPLDPTTLYVNVQHSAAFDGDATWAITRIESAH